MKAVLEDLIVKALSCHCVTLMHCQSFVSLACLIKVLRLLLSKKAVKELLKIELAPWLDVKTVSKEAPVKL